MPDGGQWMTVREFAQAAGVSIQAVYQRLDKDLTSYLKAEKGRKYINADALQFVGNSSTCQVNSSNIQAVDKHLNADEQRQTIEDLTAELAKAREDLTAAQQAAAVAAAERDAERKRADESAATVTALTAALQNEQKHAAELTAALAASQALHAGQIQLAMHDGEPKPARAADDLTGAPAADPEQEPEKKRGLFARLFGKNK